LDVLEEQSAFCVFVCDSSITHAAAKRALSICSTLRRWLCTLSMTRITLCSKIHSRQPILQVSSPHTLMTMLLLLMPSKTHVLSTGTYCSVMTLMISCDTMPPVSAPILCSSAPPARTLSHVSKVLHSVSHMATYSSPANSPICDLMAAYSSSSIDALASLTRSSAILKAIPVSFSVSVL
jgi:hypothetical protein